MQQKTLDKISYSLAVIPLLLGLYVFFYWYFQRVLNAINVQIELISFFTILFFAFCFLINVVLGTYYYLKFKSKRVLPSIFISILTIPIIFLIGTLYDAMYDKVFLKISNTTTAKFEIKRIWSDNFELEISEKKSIPLVISYFPVYKFNYNKSDSFGYEFEINQVYADLEINGQFETIKLPKYEKGMCVQLDLADLIE